MDSMKTSPIDPSDSSSQFSRALRELLPYTQLGWQMLATMMLALGAGYLADRWLGTQPVLLVVCLIVGVIVAIVQFVRTAQTLSEPDKRTRPRPHA